MTLPDISVVDTTELRWFASSELPDDVTSWFTQAGRGGFAADRYDTYCLDGPSDVGLKLRFGQRLELKVLQSYGDHIRLDADLAGRLEVWRKWSPVRRQVPDAGDQRWVDVHKSLIKRRFSPAGAELAIEGDGTPTGSGCDVEIVGLRVEHAEAWTFAFAAFGPVGSRHDSILAAWRAVTPTGPPADFGRSLTVSTGYPDWLLRTLSRTPARSRG